MTKLSVNINKVATLRNARGGNNPDVERVAQDCEQFGAQGITVHPRPDERHIRYADVRLLKPLITTEFNIEGNPIPSFTELVLEVKPKQVTLVPDGHDQLTSNHGWDTLENRDNEDEYFDLRERIFLGENVQPSDVVIEEWVDDEGFVHRLYADGAEESFDPSIEVIEQAIFFNNIKKSEA